MGDWRGFTARHGGITRRYFLGLGTAGAARAGLAGIDGVGPGAEAAAAPLAPELAGPLSTLEYLTPEKTFGTIGRGNPPPHKLPPEKRRAAGLDRDTWRLEIVPDPDTDAKVENPISKERGNAIGWDDLMRIAETNAVRFLQVITCTNGDSPFGTGLWEGVPLRVLVWMARPVANIRRVTFYGFHNNDPAQKFESSLPIGRVLEDPPGFPPVALCYKMNGAWLTPARGAPVRMVVPDAYGFKSVKWVQRVILSNLFHANDTYARWNNDIDSSLKTFARFISWPKTLRAGEPIPLTGLAQVGVSGLARVQVWIRPAGEPLPADDPHLARGEWKDAQILGPPDRWGGGLPDDAGPAPAFGFDPGTSRPRDWPMQNTIAHWAVLLPPVAAGAYELRARTIDAAGIAQPMPRPFPKGGRNAIQVIPISVEG
ncbi:MAG: molybdopterin-dependent oxidoreductase [Planctomycetes bacterium]|nr:molybdopterin-dependent oxidoreductase [Planctomycetota bacterium]